MSSKNANSIAKSNWSRHTKTVLKKLMNLYMYTQTNSYTSQCLTALLVSYSLEVASQLGERELNTVINSS